MHTMKPSTESPTLESFRARIDALDAQILAILAERRAVVAELFAWKDAQALRRIDPVREAELRHARKQAGVRHGLPEQLVEAVFDAILADARNQP